MDLSRSQIETIVLDALQQGATAMAEQLDADNVAKAVNTLIRAEGDTLIDRITDAAVQRYDRPHITEC